jgi:ribose transport system permease protein
VTFSKNGEVPRSLAHFTARSWGPVSSIALTALGMGFVISTVLRRTVIGRHFVAVGTNPVAARILGIRVIAHRVAAFTLGGLLYAFAGLLLAGHLRTPDYTLGSPYLLLTFVAVALGGAALSGGPASVLCIGASSLFLALLDEYLAVKGVGGGTETLLQGVVLVVAVGAITFGTKIRSLILTFARRNSRRSPAASDHAFPPHNPQ